MARAPKFGPYNYERALGARSYNFTATVEDFVRKTDARMTALVRQSIQDVVNIAQTPVAKGGKMRVDTGFLRASGQMSLTGLPTGPSIKPETAKRGSIATNEGQVTLTLGKVQLGSTIYFGWTANYAKYREAYDGFLESAVMQWPQIVARNTEAIRNRVK